MKNKLSINTASAGPAALGVGPDTIADIVDKAGDAVVKISTSVTVK